MFEKALAIERRSCLALSAKRTHVPSEVIVSASSPVRTLNPSPIRCHPSAQPVRPLRLVHDGTVAIPRSPKEASVYRRRRVVAAVALVLASLLSAWTLSRAGTFVAQHFGDVSPPPASRTASITTWTVRPGDTLWSIARSVQPAGDVRPVLERLVAHYGSRPLEPGEVLSIG